MTSGDTDDKTRALLNSNDYFGMQSKKHFDPSFIFSFPSLHLVLLTRVFSFCVGFFISPTHASVHVQLLLKLLFFFSF